MASDRAMPDSPDNSSNVARMPSVLVVTRRIPSSTSLSLSCSSSSKNSSSSFTRSSMASWVSERYLSYRVSDRLSSAFARLSCSLCSFAAFSSLPVSEA